MVLTATIEHLVDAANQTAWPAGMKRGNRKDLLAFLLHNLQGSLNGLRPLELLLWELLFNQIRDRLLCLLRVRVGHDDRNRVEQLDTLPAPPNVYGDALL